VDSFRKHKGGKTKANTVAEKPPVSSSTIPKSHVSKDIVSVINMSMLVMTKCRILSNGADGQ
jgi:hypothetical protein